MSKEINNVIELFKPRNVHYYDKALSSYIQAIYQPFLTEEEEKLLLNRIAQGDVKAREIFIERNLALVIYVAKKYFRSGVDPMDLIAYGNIGLILAVDKFDLGLGYKFSTYAIKSIDRAIISAIANTSRNIRIPLSKYRHISKFTEAERKLASQYNRTPTIEEIALDLNISMEEAIQLNYLKNDPSISINYFVSEEEKPGNLLECLYIDSVDNSLEENNLYYLHQKLEEIFENANLTDIELFVLKCRYGMGYNKCFTLVEITKMLTLKFNKSVSRQRINQIEQKAIEKIKLLVDTDELATFMSNPKIALERLNAFRIEIEKVKAKKKYRGN